MRYKPRKATRAILDRAWEHVRSVPYSVSARWLFYRLYQDGVYTDKGDYKSRFLPLLSRARKRFYAGWRPWILEDETRVVTTQGEGWENERAWLEAVSEASCRLDRLRGQPAILAVLFEANAMSAQFKHYLPEAAALFPFGGDPSIPSKWGIAELLANRWREYRVPICVVYFGDFDEKGLGIEKAAKANILKWAWMNEPSGDYRWKRGGLNEEHVKRYRLPLSIEGHGYQWEALDDPQASKIIESAVDGLIDRKAIEATVIEEGSITARFKERFDRLFGLKEND